MCFPMKFRTLLRYRMLHTIGTFSCRILVLFRNRTANRRPREIGHGTRRRLPALTTVPSATKATRPVLLHKPPRGHPHGMGCRSPGFLSLIWITGRTRNLPTPLAGNGLGVGLLGVPLAWRQPVLVAFHRVTPAYRPSP